MEDNTRPWWAKNTAVEQERTTKANRLKPLLSVAAFLAIVGTMVGAIALSPDPNAPYPSQFNSMAYPPDALSTLGQCGPAFDFDVPRDFTGEIPNGFFKNPNGPGNVKRTIPIQPMIVPAYGYFYGERENPTKEFWELSDKKKLPQSFEYLNYLWNGWTIIWYDRKSEPNIIEDIRMYVDEHDKVMAMPWFAANDRELPANRTIGFSGWGTSRSCGLWDSRLADAFVDFNTNQNAERDISRKYPAKLDHAGELARIDVPMGDKE